METTDNPNTGTGTSETIESLASFYAQENSPEPKRANRPSPKIERTEEAEADEAEALDGDEFPDETPDELDDDLSDEGDESEEADAEEDEPSDDEDDNSEEPDESVKVTLKNGDKTETVTLKALKEGFLRQSDYSRKTAKLAEERRSIEAEAHAVREERAQYAQVLPILAQQLQDAAMQEPNWEELYNRDRTEYLLQREQYRALADRQKAIGAEQQRLAALAHDEEVASMQSYVASQREELYQEFPQWRDAKIWDRDSKAMRKAAMSLGWTPDEIAQVADKRVVKAFYKLAIASQAASKPQPANQSARTVKKSSPASAANAPRRTSALAKASERLDKPGARVSDLAGLYAELDKVRK